MVSGDEELLALLVANLDAELATQRAARLASWRAKLLQMGPACRYLKHEQRRPLVNVQTVQGEHLAEPCAIDHHLREFWSNVAGHDPSVPLIELEVERVMQTLEPGTPMQAADLDANAVLEAIKAFKPHTACGPGGTALIFAEFPKLLQLSWFLSSNSWKDMLPYHSDGNLALPLTSRSQEHAQWRTFGQ